MVERVGVHLTRTDDDGAAIDALAAAHGGRVGIAGMLGALPRRARHAPVGRLLGSAVGHALTWDLRDRLDPVWWPQGITSSADASTDDPADDPAGAPAGAPDDGRYAGRELLVVAWYSRRDGGSRISVLDLETLRYEHVALVNRDLSPLAVHAGGIVWHGPYLHVAATARGFMTCRVDDVIRVDGRLVLPVRFAYQAQGGGKDRLRYSFLSLDRSAHPPAILTGEYRQPGATPRFARYPIDPETSLLVADDDGASHPEWLDDRGVATMQGAVVADSTYYVSVSHGPARLGSLFVGEPGAFTERRRAVPMGPEDLCWWPARRELWSLSEFPVLRWVFTVPHRS